MAQKKGFFGSIFGKQKGGCCDIRIEEIPEAEAGDKKANDDSCCCSPGPSTGNAERTLKIEWKHLDVAGETCNRCADTGEILARVVQELNKELQPLGITVEYSETKLDDTQIPQSNSIFFNGIPLEDILGMEVSENYCESCSSLLGSETYCRTIKYDGIEYEEVPAKAIRQAAYKVLGIGEAPATISANCSSCSSCC